MAQKQEWKAIGISDHGNIFGAIKLFQFAKKAGIKPVLGAEMYFTPDVKIKDAHDKYYHLLLIVQNREGYNNLCQLMAFSYQEGFYFKPRIDYAHLEKYSKGLIATTACVGGHIPTLLRDGNIDEAKRRTGWFKNLFGPERFFFEVGPPDQDISVQTNNLIFNYSKEWGVPCTVGCDAHYLSKEDNEAHEVLLAIQTKDTMDNPDRFSFGEVKGHVRTTDEIKEIFKGHEDTIWNTGLIADSCEFAFEFGKLLFPVCPVPEEYTQESYFKKLCLSGLENLKQKDLIPKDQYSKYDIQLNLEIDLIIKMGFVGYFLVVSDFIQWGKRHGIPIGPGRGSAAGSVVAWALEITNVDPLKYNLLFERFLNPERISMPDIDIDFCIERREEVINYVKDRYGHDCVCQIITFGTMMAKGVIKDVARALGFPYQDATAITDLIPEQLKITLNEAIEQEPKLKNLIETNPSVKKLFDIAFTLEGLTRHASKHAAGVVISPTQLANTLPLYIPPKSDNALVSQYSMTDLEALGFLKMDFLGLKNLTIIDNTLKSIKKNYDISIDLDKLPLDDKKTFELLCAGNTSGVFQFESDGIKDVLRKLQPDKFEDLIAVNALYRPGPLGSGMVDDYIERRHGRKQTTYMFQELEPILSETYGVIVYQEQVMKIASAIAGYSLGAADILRKAMGKKKADVMAQQKAQFLDGAVAKNFDKKKADELFDLMAYFAGYGFNKSHATAYALIAYQTAYLKARYPYEFMAQLISYETNNPDQFSFYLQEIHEMGLKLIPPDINQSYIDFTATKDSIIFGLKGIKNVGTAALESILQERNKKTFSDFYEMCYRIDLRTVNKRVLESLTYAGALDCLPGNRAQKIASLDDIIDRAHQKKEQELTGQMDLFSLFSTQEQKEKNTRTQIETYTFQELQEFSSKDKLEKEREVIGVYLSSNPLKNYPQLSYLDSLTITQCLELLKKVSSLKEPFVITYGLIQSHKIITTKKGERMAFVSLEDLSGRAEIILFPSVFKTVEQYLDKYNVFVIKGALDITSTSLCKIKANMFFPAELLWEEVKEPHHITFTINSQITKNYLEEIKKILSPGKTPFYIIFKEQEEKFMLQASRKISWDTNLIPLLTQYNLEIKVNI
jgi:DNA polymerase-3 subunit alpha